MSHIDLDAPLTRRRMLALGGAAAGAAVASTTGVAGATAGHRGQVARSGGHLPIKRMEKILRTQASEMADGVWDFPIARKDLLSVGRGVEFDGAFELSGDSFFQPLGDGRAFLNGELPVKDSEIDKVIDALLRGGLTFQAEHQHYYFLKPIRWFIHHRGLGDPIHLAHVLKHVFDQTSTRFPQTQPSNPHPARRQAPGEDSPRQGCGG